MSLFDVTAPKKQSLAQKLITGLAESVQGFGQGLGLISTGATTAATQKYAGTKLAASGVDTSKILPGLAQTTDTAMEEEILKTGDTLLYPYRQFVARPVSTALLVANENYQQQTINKTYGVNAPDVPVIGTALNVATGIFDLYATTQDFDLWKSAWVDAKQVSPGQAYVGYIGSRVDGTQGTDKLDWTNKEEVSTYFSRGPQKYISWGIDTTLSIGADPIALAGAGAGSAARKLITVPLTNKNMFSVTKRIDDAVGGKVNTWTPFLGFVRENSTTPEGLDRILSHTIVAGNVPLGRELQVAGLIANETGDATRLGQVVKVALGDSKTIDDLIYTDYLYSSDIARLNNENAIIRDALKFLNSSSAAEAGVRPEVIKIQRESIQKEAERIAEKIKDLRTKQEVVNEIIQETPVGSIQRQTVSPFMAIERARVKNATNYSDGYWGTEDVGPFAKVLHYLNPSTKLKEVPSGATTIGGIAGDYSHLEFYARLRQWGKLTGKSGDVQKRFAGIYASNLDKGARLAMLNNFDEKSMADVIIARVVVGSGMTKREQSIALEVAKAIGKESRSHRDKMMLQAMETNYTINDGSGSTILVKFLQDQVDAIAIDIARKNRGTGAEITENDIALAREVVSDSFRDIPARTAQIQNVHFGVDLKDFDNKIAENVELIRNIVSELANNPAYAGRTDYKKIIQEFSDYKSGEMLFSDKLKELVGPASRRKGKDRLTEHLDFLYSDIWKPTTLASLHYTSRNVTEGWGRALAVTLEVSRDTNMPVTQILSSTYDKGVWQRIWGNRAVTRSEKNAKALINRSRIELIGEQTKANVALADAVYASNDSLFASFGEGLVAADNIAVTYANSVAYKDIVDSMRNITYRFATTDDIPKNINGELFEKFITGDHVGAFQILASADSPYILETFAALQSKVRAELNAIDAIYASPGYAALPAGMQDNLWRLNTMLASMDSSIQGMSAAALAKAQVRGNLEDLIRQTDVLGNIKKSGEGEFELIPGLLMSPDSFAGPIGAIMRKETSAAKSGAATVFNLSHSAMSNILNGHVKRGIVNPLDAAGAQNPLWANVAADYGNRQMRDALTQRFISLDPKDDLNTVIAWAKSNDPVAVRWRNEMEVVLDSLRRTVDDPIAVVARENAMFVEATLPKYGIDGRVISPLRDEAGELVFTEAGKRIPGTNIIAEETGKLVPGLRIKALKGELTVDDMLDIPEQQRASVNGGILEKSNDNLWRRLTQSMFKWIGSLPEDTFVRHPFYRSMYQTEQRRLGQLWLSQGRTVDYVNANIDVLQDSAHRFAYKQTMERLYSVQRNTDPGEMLRFVSPFYMAKQNSNRFWFGYAMRNPQYVGRHILLWTAPGRVFDVENENGEDVENVNPFFAEGVSAKITIPDGMARVMGIPEDARLASQLSSWDLVNNGYFPFVPEAGGPVFDYSAAWLLNAASGKPWDPELLLTKFGLDPEIPRKIIAPYVGKAPNNEVREAIFNLYLNPNAWMRAALAPIAQVPVIGSIAELIDPKAVDRFGNRTIKNFKMLYEQWTQTQPENEMLNSEQQQEIIAELYSEAASYATHEQLWESFWSFGPTVGNVKIEDYANRKAAELRQYRSRFGYDEGTLKFIQDNTKLNEAGDVVSYGIYTLSTAEGSNNEVNPFGVAGTPQTVRGITQNKELWDKVSSIEAGSDNSPDNKILGSLFNQGDRNKDYTQTANNKLYSMNVKRRVGITGAEKNAIAVDFGVNEYFAILDSYEAKAEAAGIAVGSDAYKKAYKEDIDSEVEALAKRNPIWYRESGTINLRKADNNVNAVLNVLEDEKFMNTVGKNNQLIRAIHSYMVYRKPLVEQRLAISDDPDVDINRSSKYDSLVTQKEDIANEIAQQVPEFANFYKYYLKRDPLFSDREIAEYKK
jgi:hypothetical protein